MMGGAIFLFRTKHLNHISPPLCDVIEIVDVVWFEEQMLTLIGIFHIEPAGIAGGEPGPV